MIQRGFTIRSLLNTRRDDNIGTRILDIQKISIIWILRCQYLGNLNAIYVWTQRYDVHHHMRILFAPYSRIYIIYQVNTYQVLIITCNSHTIKRKIFYSTSVRLNIIIKCTYKLDLNRQNLTCCAPQMHISTLTVRSTVNSREHNDNKCIILKNMYLATRYGFRH